MNAIKKPEGRVIRYELKEPYAGFYVVAKADFPARTLVELQSGDLDRSITAFTKLVTEHNLTDADNNKVESLLDADPMDLVVKAMEGWVEALGKLPPR
tara:strand:- start:939 stop:1232 length:294 start_codon:yes stop_codon:yes gene_type:complete